VFFVRPIGFVTATAARRITYEQSLAFERVHQDAYRSCGFSVVDVPAGTVAERAVAIDRLIRSLGRAQGVSDPGATLAR
jgi:predicted ATPase